MNNTSLAKAATLTNASADEVAKRVEALDAEARRLGEACGVPLQNFDLDGAFTAAAAELAKKVDLLSVLRGMGAAVGERDYVSLMRHSGTWGLYHHRNLVSPNGAIQHLRNAPLGVREAFLVRSKEFFDSYLKRSAGRFSELDAAVSAADETLAFLKTVKG